jgi:hypothetical protein
MLRSRGTGECLCGDALCDETVASLPTPPGTRMPCWQQTGWMDSAGSTESSKGEQLP